MAWLIFRHTKKVGPFRVTLSRRGINTSIGNRWMRVGRRSDGTTSYSARIPGSGASIRRTRKD